MNLKNLFKRFVSPKKVKTEQWYDQIPEKHLLMWEDDYLMRVMLSKKNQTFFEKETKRIDEFGKEHTDGVGFSAVTVINDPTVETISLKIPLDEAANIFLSNDLARVRNIWIQGEGVIPLERLPIAFGDWNFAVVLERNNTLIEHIWFAGNFTQAIPKQELVKAIQCLSEKYELGIVNWYTTSYSPCKDHDSTYEFLMK